MKNSISVWNVKEEKFPKNGKLINKLKFLLRYAILAPSGHNSQPWKFRIDNSCLEILPDYSRSRTEVDPDDRELFISLGAVSKNIEVAAGYFGLIYERIIEKDKIIFKFKEGKVISKSKDLFIAIPKRNTNRGDYLEKQIQKDKLASIDKAAEEISFLRLIDNKSEKKELAKLVATADLIWFKSKNLVEELEGWLRDDVESSKDGLPTSVLSLYKVAVEFKYLFSGDSELAKKKAERDFDRTIKSPLLIAIVTKKDTIEDWIEAGRQYEELALRLTSLGLSNGFYNIIIQLKKPRKDLAELLKVKGSVQMLLRVGYAKEAPSRTQRRPVDEVLL